MGALTWIFTTIRRGNHDSARSNERVPRMITGTTGIPA
jgi:hypothetical protein